MRGADRTAARRRRRAARMAAVQALYQLEMARPETTPDRVIAEFLSYRSGSEAESGAVGEMDRAWFSEIVSGTARERHDIDDMIAGALAEDWTVERLDSVLRAILRAGVFELSWRQDVPPRVVIDEYVAIAHAFFDGKEPAMANGLLDHLARELRPEDMKRAPRHGGSAAPRSDG
jgi:N utilization substance protein B